MRNIYKRANAFFVCLFHFQHKQAAAPPFRHRGQGQRWRTPGERFPDSNVAVSSSRTVRSKVFLSPGLKMDFMGMSQK